MDNPENRTQLPAIVWQPEICSWLEVKQTFKHYHLRHEFSDKSPHDAQ